MALFLSIFLAFFSIAGVEGGAAFATGAEPERIPSCPSDRSFLPAPEPTPVPGPAGGPIDLELVGRIGGSVQAVAAKGSYAYVGAGAKLVVLDVSNPKAPREHGASDALAGEIQDVAVAGSFAYAAAGAGGVYILDVADPANPKIVGTYDTPGFAEGVVVKGGLAYIAGGPAGLRIVDVTDPARPTAVGDAFAYANVLDVAVVGARAFLAAGGAGLLTVDVADPAHPLEVGRLDTPGFAFGIGVSGQTVYVADGWKGVHAVDYTDPAKPRLTDSFRTSGWAMDALVERQVVYVADAFGGLRIVDGSDPGRLKGLGMSRSGMPWERFGFPGHAEKVAIIGTKALVADRSRGLLAVDVSTPTRPRKVSIYSPLGSANGVAVEDDLAVVAANRGGVRTVDLSRPDRPREIGALPTTWPAYTATFVTKDMAYVTSHGGGVLYAVDLSDPTRPTASTYLQPGPARVWTARNQFLAASTLYVATEDALFSLDVSRPRNPCTWFSMSMTGGRVPTLDDPSSTGIAVSGSDAFVAAGAVALVVFEVSDPRNPVERGRYQEPGISGEDILVDGDVVYLHATNHATGGGEIRSFDVSDPSNPALLGSYVLPARATGWGPFMALAGNILYVADGLGGLVALDVSDPTAPSLAAHLPLPGNASAVVADGKYVYVAGEGGGLFVIEPAPTSGSPTASRTTQGTAPAVTRPSTTIARAATSSNCRATSTNNAGPGSLRRCLAKVGTGATITFDPAAFPPNAPATVALTSALPTVYPGRVTIDGSNAGVVLDGSGTPPGTDGLRLNSDRNRVKGLQILNFPGDGIEVGGRRNTIGGDRANGAGPLGEGNVISGNGANGVSVVGPLRGRNRVVGNYIGLDASGTKVLGNRQNGVWATTNNNVIGGSSPADRNVISGNGFTEVENRHQGIIRGNYIGTDATGSVNLSDAGYWAVVTGLATVVEDNVIVGGTWAGILIFDLGNGYNRVVGNLLGTDATGTQALGDASILMNTPFNQIGGPTSRERNVINGGVTVVEGAGDNVIAGNLLGTDVTGHQPLGAGNIGVEGAHNFVGGATVQEGNILVGPNGMNLASGADSNFVACNHIGLDFDGDSAPSGGITLSVAARNVLQGNVIRGIRRGAGITLGEGAVGNWVRANRIVDGQTFGIAIPDGDANLITHNSLIDNAPNASDLGSANRWDDGVFGNFWSDYSGQDTNGDGIGDTPYQIATNSIDRFPMMLGPGLGCLE